MFRGDSLADTVEEFSQYNRTLPVRVEGQAVSERRLWGVFELFLGHEQTLRGLDARFGLYTAFKRYG